MIYLSKKNQKLTIDDYQDYTPAHIILKIDDLIIEKAKNQKNIDVVLSGFVGNKDNSDVDSKIFHTKSSFEPTTAEKYSKKIMKKINHLFYYNRHQ